MNTCTNKHDTHTISSPSHPVTFQVSIFMHWKHGNGRMHACMQPKAPLNKPVQYNSCLSEQYTWYRSSLFSISCPAREQVQAKGWLVVLRTKEGVVMVRVAWSCGRDIFCTLVHPLSVLLIRRRFDVLQWKRFCQALWVFIQVSRIWSRVDWLLWCWHGSVAATPLPSSVTRWPPTRLLILQPWR